MMTHRFTRWFPVFCVASLFGLAVEARACSVPVFRYALDRWPADAYEVIVFHRGKLKDGDKSLVAGLEKTAVSKGGHANLDLITVDLGANPEPAMQKLWEEQSNAQLPWMVVRYPQSTRRDETVWATRLTESSAAVLLDSPLRQQFSRLIRKGETGVWLLLESGDKEKDDAAAERLTRELQKMPQLLKLPELKADDPEDRLTPGPKLRISFTLLRLSRTDPAEQALVQMLLHTENDLLKEEFAEQPMAFPIFGRGRADYALIGKGITVENIQEACARLIGPCTCQVKRLYPGIDLLVRADWDERLSDWELPDLGPAAMWLGVERLYPGKAGTVPRLLIVGAVLAAQGRGDDLLNQGKKVKEFAENSVRAYAVSAPVPPKPAPVVAEEEPAAPPDSHLRSLLIVLGVGVAGTIAAVVAFGRWRRLV